MNESCLELFTQVPTASDDVSKKEQLVEWLTSNPVIGWSIAIFAVLNVGIAAVAKFTGNLDKIIGFVNKYRPKKHKTADQEPQRLRQQLIEVVLWQVVKRLEKSLHYKIRLDLKRQEERERVGKPDLPMREISNPSKPLIRRIFNSIASSQSESIELHTSTATLLNRDDIEGRLLILGEPGSGKTNELLTVARELLQKAQQSNNSPIPVIFELSEWSRGQNQTLADWLTEQLQEKYDLPPKVAKQWIKQNQLFPLLDGLDELRRVDDATNTTTEEIDQRRQARQIECIRAINEFLDVHPYTSMVVCCRRREYEALQAQAEYLKRLNGAIYIQELDNDQIVGYLNACNRGSLWETLQNQPKLLKLTRSPLFLLMLVVAYQGQPIQSTEQLLDLYIDKQLNDLNNQGAYPPGKAPSAEKTHHYLSWLATQLERNQVTEFLIERLQPNWLEPNREKVLYRLSIGLITGLIPVLIFVPMYFELGELQWLILGLIFSPIVGFFISISEEIEDIKPVENLYIPWRKVLYSRLNIGFSIGLIFGLFGLILGLETMIQNLIWGLVYGLGLGLIYKVSSNLRTFESKIDDKQLPNQAIKRSLRRLLSLGLIAVVIIGLIGQVIEGLHYVLMEVLYFVVTGQLLFLGVGLTPIIKHLCLRFTIYRSGISPWNYEKFLEHAENHRFIQRVGGRYRFVHDLLRKRFAERYQFASIEDKAQLR